MALQKTSKQGISLNIRYAFFIVTNFYRDWVHFQGRQLLSFSFLPSFLTLLHSERPKLYAILAFLSAIGLMEVNS